MAFYLVGVYIILTTLNMFLTQYVSSDLQFVTVIIISIYFMYALTALFIAPKWAIILKSLIVYFVSIFLYIFSAFALSFLIVYIQNQ